MASKFNRVAAPTPAPAPRARAPRAKATVTETIEMEQTFASEETIEAALKAEGITTKDVVCLLVASVFGFIGMSICMALLAPFVWFWLNVVISFLATLYVGNKFNAWFDTTGYDRCANTVSKLGGLITGRFASLRAA